MNLFSKPMAKFKTKAGKEIEIYPPTIDRLPELLKFINRLVAEDTYLNLSGRAKTLKEEESWLKATLAEIRSGKNLLYWAVYDKKIVGNVNILHGFDRSWHVGKIGLMVDRDFRGDGIGQALMDLILEKAKDFDIKIAILELFDDNKPAVALYKKMGFKEYGRLPSGLFRKGKFSDTIEMYKNL